MNDEKLYIDMNEEIESAGVKYRRVGITSHYENEHDNPNPYEIASYIWETLKNHSLQPGRNEILSCTAGLVRDLKGWPDNFRKTIIDAFPNSGTIDFVTQYPLTEKEYLEEKRKL